MSTFKVGDQVVDLKAMGDYWPSRQGEVVGADGSRIKVCYFSGFTRWRKDTDLALETSREAGAERLPRIKSLRIDVVADPEYVAMAFNRWNRGPDRGGFISRTYSARSVSKASLERFIRAQRKMIEEIVPGAD